MRTYYIFNVSKHMSILTKDSPYMLFKSFESIYKSNSDELYIASHLYEQLAIKINKDNFNNKINLLYEDNQYYMYRNNYHYYYNKYRDEMCDLKVKNSYLVCKCHNSHLELLKKVRGYNLFACDFENKDYFWLEEIYC